VKSRTATNQASRTVVQEKRNKATLGMQRAQRLIDSLILRAPMDGTVSIKETARG
jgi:multidrug resistance efflux pump